MLELLELTPSHLIPRYQESVLWHGLVVGLWHIQISLGGAGINNGLGGGVGAYMPGGNAGANTGGGGGGGTHYNSNNNGGNGGSGIVIIKYLIPSNPVYSYTWSNGANSSSIVVSPTINTTYSVSLTNTTGCSGNSSVITLSVSPLNVQILNPGTIPNCSSGTLTAMAYGSTPIIQTYTLVGANSFTVPAGITSLQYLIVAGGGSGGVDNGGGGGGGGVLTGTTSVNPGQTYTINVGAGGAARLGTSDDGPGNNGGNSSAFGQTAIGGSGGTGWTNSTLPPGSSSYSGGSGAGQSASNGGVNAVGAGIPISGQGYAGGTAISAYAGGGGGAGGAGGNASSGNVGAGGEGLNVGATFGNSIGVNGYVGGGGAGGFDHASNYSSTLPFTRNGTVKKLNQTAEDPCPNNTGAGGNGSNHNNNTSGAGGSGIVIIKYFFPSTTTYSYTWSNGGANSSSIVVSPTVNTTYSVVLTNSAGCSANSSPITLSITPLNIQIVNPGTIPNCSSGTLQAFALGNPVTFTYSAIGASTFVAPAGLTSLQYLIVAGGGGGGSDMGG